MALRGIGGGELPLQGGGLRKRISTNAEPVRRRVVDNKAETWPLNGKRQYIGSIQLEATDADIRTLLQQAHDCRGRPRMIMVDRMPLIYILEDYFKLRGIKSKEGFLVHAPDEEGPSD